MTSLIKFELGKILRNRTVFGGIVVGCLVLLGIFFVGYHYSQLSMSERLVISWRLVSSVCRTVESLLS